MTSYKIKIIILFSFFTLATTLLTEAKTNVDNIKPIEKAPGIFQKFLRQFLDMATRAIPEKKLIPFTKTLFKYVNELKYSYTKKLAKKLNKISHLDGDEILEEYQEFLDMLDKENEPKKEEFLEEMDKVFTIFHEGRFDDYIQNMEEYGRGEKLDLNEETRKLVHDVINTTILGRGHRIVDELEDKWTRALKEQGYHVRGKHRSHHRSADESKVARKDMGLVVTRLMKDSHKYLHRPTRTTPPYNELQS